MGVGMDRGGLEILVNEWRICKVIDGLEGRELEEGGGAGKCMEKLADGWRGWWVDGWKCLEDKWRVARGWR